MASEAYAAPLVGAVQGRSPWYLAYRRLRRNRVALAFGALFIVVVVFCLAAPLWASNVAHTGPNSTHTTEVIVVNGQRTDVVSKGGLPISPVYFGAGGKFFLGADGTLGRDEMVRLMYGGQTSLLIGFGAGLLTTLLAVALGLIGGFYGGWRDGLLSRTMDVIWAFPVLLLGIAIGTVVAVGGLNIGPVSIPASSILIPTLIIGVVYVPYMYRPIRGEVLAMREKEFVEAAVAQGAGPIRIMFSELLPNLLSTIVVFFALNIANSILTESALSFLGAGVHPPNSSWGTMIADGIDLLTSAPWLTIVPGAMILLTVLSLNVFSDGLRDALDPRGSIRVEERAARAEGAGGI